MDLYNDTAVNVVALLKEPLGSSRTYPLQIDHFPLDQDLSAENVEGDVKLTRLIDEILARVRANGEATLQCLRCLQDYPQPFESDFTEEFRIAHDVRTGSGIATSDDDERFTINENHELDFGEALRQEIVVALPMRPTCRDACPGPDMTETGDNAPVDDRFAALARLLDEEAPGASS